MSDHDNQLIAEYDARRGEEAFAALVRLHINLVFATALRQVGDTGAAEEITQNVFVALARASGKLKSHPTIAAWLYRTTLNKSREWLRSELRRRRREQFAASQTLARVEGDSVWSPLVPLLDEALLKLHESDRLAVILHYMEGQTFQEVGSALGVAEDTARKRVNRCLQQLMDFFQRRGFAVQALKGGAPLFSLSLHTAPAGLAGSVTTAGLAAAHSGASTSILTLIKGALKIMAWTKTQTAIVVGTALIVATGTSVVVIAEVHAPKIVPSAFAGLPQTPAELNAWYVEPPAGQNAATFELQGISARQIAGVEKTPDLPILGHSPAPPLSAPLSPAMKSALTTFLQGNHDALQFFGQGAQYDQSRYSIDFTKGPEIPLPYLAGIKTGMQMEEMAAILDAENNDGQRAAEDVLAGMGLARSLDAEPILISQLVRAAGVALSAAALEQVVNRTTVSSESLDKLSSAFQSMEAYDRKGEGFNRAVVGEDVNGLALLKDRASLLQVFNTDHKMIEYLNRTTNLKGEQDYFTITFEELMSARQKTFPDRLQEVNDVIQQRVAKARSRGLLYNATNWDAMQSLTIREGRCLANLRLAMTAIALEQFRAAHGNQYPATLAALTPVYLTAAPLDPFDGKSLRYQKRGAGYMLYSIGPDPKDYGERGMTRGGNIPFSVIRPPPY